MRIDALNQVSQLYQTSKPKKAVTSGVYNVSAAEIADKMIGKYFDSIF